MIHEKKELRQQVKLLKQQLTQPEILLKSEMIFNQLENLEVFKLAQNIMIYWSMDDEVHTHNFILKWTEKKTMLLPVVEGDHLRIKQFKGIETMKPGSLKGIMEPDGDDFPENETIDIIIVPGVAFDKKNNRLGRGKGFYDKLLHRNDSIKIGICFDFQLFEIVPSEPHDISMDLVIWG